MLHLKDLHVLILGLGASGLAMARWCARHGAQVTVADTRETPPQLAALLRDVPNAQFSGGAFTADLVEGTNIRAVYRSPGLAPQVLAPVIDAARAMGLVLGGELDLFNQALKDLTAQSQQALAEAAAAAEALAAEEAAQAAAAEPVVEAAPVADVAQEPSETSESAESNASEAPEVSEAPEAPAEPTEAAEAPEATALTEDADAPLITLIAPPPVPVGYQPIVLAITGTNGKTTVTSLTGQLVERAGKTVAVAGNIGPTLLDTLSEHLDKTPDLCQLPQVWVLELSSFQLDASNQFEPTAATVLNLSQDHLDWHGSMEAYGAAKARVFGRNGLMLLNRDDAAVMAMLPPPVRVKLQKPQIRAHVTFGGDMPQRPGDFGLEITNGMAWLVRAMEADETKRKRNEAAEDLHIQRLMPADALRIRGRHNAINALAALALATAAGCTLAPMLYGLREYQGEPHRVEPVAMVNDVEYFDDSKGTNVGATVAALIGLGSERKLVVILGGDGKGQDFTPLIDPVQRYVRSVLLIGRDAPQIRAALADAGVPMHDLGSDASAMENAVQLAARQAQPGDAVLMSPACASLDMFENYGHRARVFVAAVQALEDSDLPFGDEGGLA